MSTHKFEQFSYTPIELAESMTRTVHDTVAYLASNNYISEQDFLHLTSTLAVFPMPNRKGFGQRLRERFFGKNETDTAYVFPIIEIDHQQQKPAPKTKKPKLNVVEGDFGKDK